MTTLMVQQPTSTTLLTIQQVAARSGLSVHTLRYYERIGLLGGIGRASNGHRRYSEDDIGRITFLNKLRATGMPIQQMQRFTALYLEGNDTLRERRALLEQHRQEVERQICELEETVEFINWKISLYAALE